MATVVPDELLLPLLIELLDVNPADGFRTRRLEMTIAGEPMSVQVHCDHHNTAIRIYDPPEMTARQMERQHADGWRVALPPIPRPASPMRLSSYTFTDGRGGRFLVYLGQCPDCGCVTYAPQPPSPPSR
jgi:hypothetical protein